MYPTVRPTWKEITYSSFGPTGEKPYIKYHPVSSDLRGKFGQKHVSVSHDGDYVYSTVLIEGALLRPTPFVLADVEYFSY